MVDNDAPGRSRRATVYACVVSVAGWSFDLFDLFILLYVAGPVGQVIFPADRPTLSLAAVYASFAVSVVLRPAGAVIFGGIADRHGRKKNMALVLSGLGLVTAAMGAVPGYLAIGVLAPALFLLLRLIQGLFVGGMVAATHTLGTESVAPRWRGLMSGLISGGGACVGGVAASGLFLLVSHLFPGEAFTVWGWRVMFFAGLVASVLSYAVLRGARESPVWSARSRDEVARARLSDLVGAGRGRGFVLDVVLVAGAGAQYYLTAGYLPTLLDQVLGVARTAQGVVLLVANVVVLFAAIVAGQLSQWLGRRRTMLLFGVANLVLLPLLVWMLSRTDPGHLGPVILYASALVFFAIAAIGPVIAHLNERYPTVLRARATSVCWNTGFMVGGLMPTFLSLASPTLADVPGRLSGFLLAVVVVFVAANLISRRDAGIPESATLHELSPVLGRELTPGRGRRET